MQESEVEGRQVQSGEALVALMREGAVSPQQAVALGAATAEAATASGAHVEAAEPRGGERRERSTRVRSVSVVVPACNEEQNLGALLAELQRALGALDGVRSEILVIDDGSKDATASIARDAGVRLIQHPRSLGNGAAIKRGIRAAELDWVLMLDGDGQHPPGEIAAMVACAEGHDMVVASRGGRGGVWYRNIANRVYAGLASYVTQTTIPDLTSGFRLVRADLAKGFAYLLPNTFSYPTTLTLSLLRAGYSVAFHPFAVRQRRGKSHIRLLEDGSRFLMIILKIATFFAPLRVFVPLSLLMALAGVAWYLVTYWTTQRFTNMTVVLLTQATVVFSLGLIAEQIAAMRFERIDRGDDR